MHYQKLLENTIGILLENFHFYGCLMQRCVISWTDKIPTAGVRVLPNSSIEMVINPEFFCMLTEKERVGLIKHEMLHLVNDHMSRSFGLEPNLANVSMDTAINQFIPVNFLPPGALTPKSVVADENKNRQAKGEKAIELPNFEAFEVYYNILNREMPKQANKFQNPHQFQGDLDQQGQGQGQGQGQQSPGQNNPGQQNQQQGQNPGQGQPDPNGSKQAGQGSQPNHSPHVIDNHEIWQTSGMNAEDARMAVQNTLARATEDTIRQFGEGSIPDAIRNMINETLKPPKVNWKKVLRNYIGRKMSFERSSTRKRPNRRLGLKASGKTTKQGPKTLFAVDCSGSVSDAQYLEIMSEIKEAVKNFPDKCDMVFFDYELFKEKVKIGAMKQVPRRPLCGGTSFEPVMQYAKEFKPDLLIILTDGEAPTPTNPDCPVLWAIVGGHDNPKLFGKRILIDTGDGKKVSKTLGSK